jgi:hypothetical protein
MATYLPPYHYAKDVVELGRQKLPKTVHRHRTALSLTNTITTRSLSHKCIELGRPVAPTNPRTLMA